MTGILAGFENVGHCVGQTIRACVYNKMSCEGVLRLVFCIDLYSRRSAVFGVLQSYSCTRHVLHHASFHCGSFKAALDQHHFEVCGTKDSLSSTATAEATVFPNHFRPLEEDCAQVVSAFSAFRRSTYCKKCSTCKTYDTYVSWAVEDL